MTDDKVAELRGYSRGYAAGSRRKRREVSAEVEIAKREAFRRQVFLVALPAFIASNTWVRGEKKLTTLDDRVDLAWRAANKAVADL